MVDNTTKLVDGNDEAAKRVGAVLDLHVGDNLNHHASDHASKGPESTKGRRTAPPVLAEDEGAEGGGGGGARAHWPLLAKTTEHGVDGLGVRGGGSSRTGGEEEAGEVSTRLGAAGGAVPPTPLAPPTTPDPAAPAATCSCDSRRRRRRRCEEEEHKQEDGCCDLLICCREGTSGRGNALHSAEKPPFPRLAWARGRE
uniref:Uncharacterized protein n=1 Tax=Oryza sativa subsp. japonica TaxID=39947 RepID=Q67VS9_ORYSJ|nr:hypothetical protein [Oryza sativa Japonica Group]